LLQKFLHLKRHKYIFELTEERESKCKKMQATRTDLLSSG